MREELGLAVEPGDIVGMYWFFLSNGDERVCTVFRCIPSGGAENVLVDLSAEEGIVEYRWVTKEEFSSAEFNVLHDSLKTLIAHTPL